MFHYLRCLGSSRPTPDTNVKPFSPKLPPELWNLIFVHVTAPNPTSRYITYFPEQLGERFRKRHIRLKRSLVLVCKLWHAIALPRLYEIVWMQPPRMAPCFLRTLVDSASSGPQAGYGKWVRHLILPEIPLWARIQLVDILKYCPDIHTLSKPSTTVDTNLNFWHGIACTHSCTTCYAFTPLMSLRHVHWACSISDEIPHIDALRLSILLSRAPNLTSLCMVDLAPIGPKFTLRIPEDQPLTALTTLGYHADNKTLSLRQADVPNLTHIIASPGVLHHFNPSDPNRSSILSVFGKHLRVIDFPDKVFLTYRAVQDVRSVLDQCPNLHTLSYNINTTVLPHENAVLHPSLSVIVLRVNPNASRDDEVLARCLRMHITTLTGAAFPALRRVVLEFDERWDRPVFSLPYLMMRQRLPQQRVDGADIIWEC